MLQLVERTIVRYACWARLVSQHMLLQVLGQLPNNCEVRSPTTPVCPAWPAARSEQLFVLTTPSRKNAEQKKKKSRGTAVWATPTPNKSESPSPTARLVKPDPPRLTEHTKCRRYFVGVTLLCSIVCGSLWVFVAIFMRFCATS